jgi:hypothetical protein
LLEFSLCDFKPSIIVVVVGRLLNIKLAIGRALNSDHKVITNRYLRTHILIWPQGSVETAFSY